MLAGGFPGCSKCLLGIAWVVSNHLIINEMRVCSSAGWELVIFQEVPCFPGVN